MEGREAFALACGLLPTHLRDGVRCLCPPDGAEEVRLRVGQPVWVCRRGEKLAAKTPPVTGGDLEQVLDRATDHSRYTARETLAHGYVQAAGGLRIGVCGKVIREGGESRGFREISSLSIRIPGSQQGVAAPYVKQLMYDGRLKSTLILSPPGGGKTTFLRDLVRLVSTGGEDAAPLCVSLVDGRGELAAMHGGVPRLDVGVHTDVLEQCPKALAVPMLLRTMSPQVLALDELAREDEAQAALAAAGCGVSLLATVHAENAEGLGKRKIGRMLLESGVFEKAVVIAVQRGRRTYRVEDLP